MSAARPWLVFGAAVVALALSSRPAEALPRFAARNGLRCVKCHVNPNGGGPRTRFGADVFAMQQLAFTTDAPEDWVEVEEVDTPKIPFSGAITEWLSVGGDLRLAYFVVAPRDGATPDEDARVSTTFFLMQADLYHVAELGSHLTLVFDIGVNSGFEAWALLRPFDSRAPVDVMLKVGRFLPAFGLRDVNHSLFTRQTVGLGPSDQDTGLELVLDARNFALTLGLYNGTFGDRFDGIAAADRAFDKSALVRASTRLFPGPLAVELGGAALFNQNATRANPVLSIPNDVAAFGVDELRVGGFLVAGLGRFALLADALLVRDSSALDRFEARSAFAGYAELSAHVTSGLDVLAGLELLRPDLDDAATRTQRWSVAAELFPWHFTELRVMARYQHGPGTPLGAIVDVVAFLHAYL